MEAAGFWMFGLVVILLITTGLPAFTVLIGVSVLFSILGVATGSLPSALLTALPARIAGLLDNDLLQALPLYVLMGALLNRLPLADLLFRAGTTALSRTASAPLLAGIGLGAMLAPMNGSVGASTAMLSRVVQPRLLACNVPPPQTLATVCVAGTLGVVVPPSLVLILLGDAMLRAHTEAVNATRIIVRVINTQDVFCGALVPAAMLLLACLGLAWITGRRPARRAAPTGGRLGARDWLIAGATPGFIAGLLAGVVAGFIYAVEAAATGALALVAYGLITRTLRPDVLGATLRDTMAVTGALFALFVAATSFTLVFRAFGTDQLFASLVGRLPSDPMGAAVSVLVLLGLCAFVLDAFEIILVIVPLLMPALLIRVPDAVWVSVLTLLALQASFLTPPFGYSVMMARTMMARPLALGPSARALAPFLCVQLVVLGLTVTFPQLTHILTASGTTAPQGLSEEEVRQQLESIGPSPQQTDR
jgi:tripartite ATP-independent transporter DctM subunit